MTSPVQLPRMIVRFIWILFAPALLGILPAEALWSCFSQRRPVWHPRGCLRGAAQCNPRTDVVRTAIPPSIQASPVSVEPLAAVLRSAVAESALAQLEELAHINSRARQRRIFGETEQQVGHEVTFLHTELSHEHRALLWKIAEKADDRMPAWGHMVRRLAPRTIALRCCEAIVYSSNDGEGDSLGWHVDGSTLFTVVVALSSAGADFEGGELELKGPNELRHLVSDLQRGDSVVFRGWETHRVRQCRKGTRRVIVAEWWLGDECSGEDLRPRDTEDTITAVLGLHDGTFDLHLVLAACLLDKGDVLGAARSIADAVRIDPHNIVWPSYLSRSIIYFALMWCLFRLLFGDNN